MPQPSNISLDVATADCRVYPQLIVGNTGIMRTPKTRAASAERQAFAVRLQALRQSYGQSIGQPLISRGEFASMLDLEGETYRRYERGETEPPLRVLQRIRALTGVNLNSLVAGDIDRAA